MKLLIVEDSERLRRSLGIGLKNLGYAIDATGDGREAVGYILVNDYDVILLDLMLPSLDGLSILKEIRDRKKNTAVIIISAKDQVDDRVTGLEYGADDYLCKPFDFEELHARIKSLIRRTHNMERNTCEVGKVSVDIAMRQASVDDTVVNLTPNEFAILELLMLNKGRVMTYENIENHLYDSYSAVTRNAIEAHISAIRKKLKTFNICDFVQTKRGFGYYIDNQ